MQLCCEVTVSECLYEPNVVPLDLRPLFDQLRTEFSEYQVWVRRENFNRDVLAAIVNPARGTAVTIPVSRPSYQRRVAFEQSELGRIRSHLEVGSRDLALP